MQVHVFGATSSPCVCMYALRRAAVDNQAKYPEALRRMSNVYVDNWLESFDSMHEARRAYTEMKDLLSNSGFHLRKCMDEARRACTEIKDTVSGVREKGDVTRAINDGDLCTVNSHDRVYWFSQKPDHKYFVVCITPANYLFQSVWIGTLSNGCVEIHNVITEVRPVKIFTVLSFRESSVPVFSA
ncbi:hypothetical protein M513_12768 [Trichuris suis]|uniref:Uncharacterized protein n=1 Tax=Trichuris suis TaxID=68888 RepID=A0A085LN06_9BILA|nr:hypothetical protein M513_12768 [Trichuris suis]